MSQDYFDDLREFNEDQIGCMRRGLNPSEKYEPTSISPVIDGIRQDLKIAFSYFEKKFKEFDSNFEPRKGIYPIALKELIARKEFLISEKEELDGDKGSERLKIRNGTETLDEKRLRLEREERNEKECEQGCYEGEPEFVKRSKVELSKLTARERLTEKIKEIENGYRFYDEYSIEYRMMFPDERRERMISIENEYRRLKEILLLAPNNFKYSRYEVMRWMCENNYIPKFKFLEKDRKPSPSDFPIFYLDGSVVCTDDFLIDMSLSRKSKDPQQQKKIITHSTKAKRRDSLSPVIEQAQLKCHDPQDVAEVWAVLLTFAEEKIPPLRGATEDGLQFLKDGNIAYFDREALRKRLDRQTPLIASNRL
nr:hypothetical protein [uncultured Rhodoferax sp.]